MADERVRALLRTLDRRAHAEALFVSTDHSDTADGRVPTFPGKRAAARMARRLCYFDLRFRGVSAAPHIVRRTGQACTRAGSPSATQA